MCVGNSVLVIGKTSWILLEKLEKKKKISKKNGGPPELEAWPPIRDGPPFFWSQQKLIFLFIILGLYPEPRDSSSINCEMFNFCPDKTLLNCKR